MHLLAHLGLGQLDGLGPGVLSVGAALRHALAARDGQIDALVGNVKGMPREQLTRDVLVSLAFAFRSISDEELDDVIRFYRSPEGRWFNDTSIEAITLAIGKASREVGEKMGNALLIRKVML